MVYISSPSPHRPSRLEQTIFIVLASLAGLAFIVIITLLLCKFQCQVQLEAFYFNTFDFAQVGGSSGSVREAEAGVNTATTSTSPLSARELVEISLLHSAEEEDMDRPGSFYLVKSQP